MGFDDFPIVDESAKASEESVLAVKGVFTKKNGFIAREIQPDYGVDLEAELVLNGKNASGWQFSIQIKSSQDDVTIVSYNQKEFISYPFKTSRIGYLCRKPPAYGLIVIYDDKNKIGYYDYVEEIVERIRGQRNSDDWKKQDQVNITIPRENVLSQESVPPIFNKLLRRFENQQSMVFEHGAAFGIPVFFKEKKEDLKDLNTPEAIIGFLEKFGIALFNRQDFLIVDTLLNRLTFDQITRSRKLLFIAAITLEGVGKFVDAEYFINKALLAVNEYSDNEKNLLEILKAKIDYSLGNITCKDYLEKLEKALSKKHDDVTDIWLKGRILHLKVGTSKIFDPEFDKIFVDVVDLLSLIDEAHIDEILKHHYKINLATELGGLVGRIAIQTIGSFKIREKSFGFVPIYERILVGKTLLNLLGVTGELYKKALIYANEKKDTFLQACVIYLSALTFFQLHWGLSIIVPDSDDSVDTNAYSCEFNNLMFSYNFFIKKGLLEHAYNALTIALEINKMYFERVQKDISGINGREIEERVESLGKEIGRPKYNSIVDDFKKHQENIDKEDPAQAIMRFSDKEIEEYSQTILENLALPKDRLKNIIFDLKFLRDAYTALAGSGFEVIQDLKHTESRETMYNLPLVYRLTCKKCGFFTNPSGNLERLLNDKRIRHSHVCL